LASSLRSSVASNTVSYQRIFSILDAEERRNPELADRRRQLTVVEHRGSVARNHELDHAGPLCHGGKARESRPECGGALVAGGGSAKLEILGQ
jgi:hypothetical protein